MYFKSNTKIHFLCLYKYRVCTTDKHRVYHSTHSVDSTQVKEDRQGKLVLLVYAHFPPPVLYIEIQIRTYEIKDGPTVVRIERVECALTPCA